MLVATVLASILACFSNVASVSVGLEKGVAALNHTNFEDAKASTNFPVLLATFYEPKDATSRELLESLEKSAKGKELKSMQVRVAKIDAVADSSLAQQYGVHTFPSIVAFKDGSKHSQQDATLWQKQEIRAYATAVAGEQYLFTSREVYNGMRFKFKLALRSTFLPAGVRTLLYTGFPLVLLMLVLFPCSFYYCCCKSSSGPGKPKKKQTNGSKRDRNASQDPAEDEKEGEKTEEKEDDEKKED